MQQGLQIKLCEKKSMSPHSSEPQTLMRGIAEVKHPFFVCITDAFAAWLAFVETVVHKRGRQMDVMCKVT